MGIPRVKQKLTITGGEALTITDAQNSLGTLRQLGAPPEGQIQVRQGPEGWSIFVEWTPEPAPQETRTEEGPVRCYTCQGKITQDLERPSGWRHLDALAVTDKHPATPDPAPAPAPPWHQ